VALARVGPRPCVLERDDDEARAEDIVHEIDAGLARAVARARVLASMPADGIALSESAVSFPRAVAVSGSSVWQHEFLACVQSPEPARVTLPRTRDLAPRLAPETKGNFDAYRLGYFSRVTATLAGTLFQNAAALVSTAYVSGILGRFREAIPSTQANLTASSEGVAAFARTLPDVAKGVPWLPEFLDLCQLRWTVLTGPDPLPRSRAPFAPATAVLQGNAAFLRSTHPLFDLWRMSERMLEVRADGTGEGVEDGVEAQAQAVLVFKSGPTDLEMILVNPMLMPFVGDLILGNTVLEAIEAMEARAQDVDEDLFGSFLATLTQRNAWTMAEATNEPGT
jgi:hypothetical protein